MPPWKAAQGYGEFVGERRLAEADLATIARWVAGGAPEGDARDLPPRASSPQGPFWARRIWCCVPSSLSRCRPTWATSRGPAPGELDRAHGGVGQLGQEPAQSEQATTRRELGRAHHRRDGPRRHPLRPRRFCAASRSRHRRSSCRDADSASPPRGSLPLSRSRGTTSVSRAQPSTLGLSLPSRCPAAMPKCSQVALTLRKRDGAGEVACLLYD
jgi:hypothetical protein